MGSVTVVTRHPSTAATFGAHRPLQDTPEDMGRGDDLNTLALASGTSLREVVNLPNVSPRSIYGVVLVIKGLGPRPLQRTVITNSVELIPAKPSPIQVTTFTPLRHVSIRWVATP